MAGLPNSFEEFTPEQLAYWIREVRPLLIEMQERSTERARQHALALIRAPLREPAGIRRFRFGEFGERAAQAVNLQVVTVATHDDPETGQPGCVHARKLALYVSGKPYLMLLPEDFTEGVPNPDAVVFLTEVKTITVRSDRTQQEA